MSKAGVLISVFLFYYISQISQGYVLSKIECPFNPTVCETPTCSLSAPKAKPQLYQIEVGCKLKKRTPEVQVRISSFILVGKEFVPIKSVDTSFNFCQVNRFTDNKMLKIVAPGIADQLKTIVRSCPYEDEFKFERFQLDGAAIPDILGRKPIRTEVKFTRGKYTPLFSVIFYGNTSSGL